MSLASNDSRNTYGPSFQLDMTSLMQEFAESDRPEEAAQVGILLWHPLNIHHSPVTCLSYMLNTIQENALFSI